MEQQQTRASAEVAARGAAPPRTALRATRSADGNAPRATPLIAGLPLTRSRSSMAAPGIKLVGMPLTRSKSDRARLLSLAQDILAEANQLNPPPKQAAPAWAAGAGLRTRSQSWATRAVNDAPAPLPFVRSAASDLAVSFGPMALI